MANTGVQVELVLIAAVLFQLLILRYILGKIITDPFQHAAGIGFTAASPGVAYGVDVLAGTWIGNVELDIHLGVIIIAGRMVD